MNNNKKYLAEAELKNLLGALTVEPTFIPMSQDTYNESQVVEAILKTKKQLELQLAAINMSCIGYGGKRYGLFKLKEEVIDIALLLKGVGVRLALEKDTKLNENELTPQRLCRAFRNHTREYIVKHNFETYLFRKYSDHNANFAHICFRGSEYLDDLSKDEVDYLLVLYAKMDLERNTKIAERVKRVFQAKGYMKRTIAQENP